MDKNLSGGSLSPPSPPIHFAMSNPFRARKLGQFLSHPDLPTTLLIVNQAIPQINRRMPPFLSNPPPP
jgi:hypothetical protein